MLADKRFGIVHRLEPGVERPTRETLSMIHRPQRLRISGFVAAAILAGAAAAHAQNYPITPQQRSTAQQVAQAGVALSELAPNAPDQYTVKRGDTLWDISKLFLRSPWRWPELWGMNKDQIKNPHLIYPGQVLLLVKEGGRARLQLAGSNLQPGFTLSGLGALAEAAMSCDRLVQF